jgi:acyl carrier protein
MSQENQEKYDKIFIENFKATPEQLPGLTYQSIPSWDSVGHMAMVAELEDAFDIMLEMDDIIDLSSYEEGKRILEKYDIGF